MSVVSKEEIQILKRLSDSEFDTAFASEVRAEAKQSMRVVYFIREADRRKHWMNEFSSLAAYCAKFGISNGDFYRKLSVLNTIRDIPEVEEKIITGVLSPTTVAQVNTFCRAEAKARQAKVPVVEKRALLLKIEGQSQRIVERELALLSPQSAAPDKKRQISENLFTNQFTSDLELEKKLTRLKEILSNSLPSSPSQNELLHKICDIALGAVDPIKKAEKAVARKIAREVQVQVFVENEISQTLENESRKTPVLVIKRVNEVSLTVTKSEIKPSRLKIGEAIKRSRMINAETKHFVRLRDQDRCAAIHSATGKRCEARHGLQFDHIVPFAKGGENTLENLRQVCRNHNQWFAIQQFGREKMAEYLLGLKDECFAR